MTTMVQDCNRLLHRRQFVLGPAFLPSLEGWNRYTIAGRLRLSVHPDLGVQQVSSGEQSLTLLGFILDPDAPASDDTAILRRLLDSMTVPFDFRRWIRLTYGMGGRWILIVHDGKTTKLVTDAMGLRQVFFSDPEQTSGIWCATEPGIVAEALGLGMDPVAVTELLMCEQFQQWAEFLWPGDSSPYREFRRLLPNRYLDLDTGASSRYWPDEQIQLNPLDEAVESTADLLKRLVLAGGARFKLSLAITAGWDSRLLLAASREISSDIWHFTFARSGATADTTIAPRLLKRLGLPHHMLAVPDRMDDDLADMFRGHVCLSRPFSGRFAQALLEQHPHDRVCMTGNAAEIARVRFRLPADQTELLPMHLAKFMKFQPADRLEKLPFVLGAWERWQGELGETFNVEPLDLFYWEHWAGNFAAMDQAESDIAVETFTPYNCRRLLTTMLSADARHRNHDTPSFHPKVATRLWPAVMMEPINPLIRPSLPRKAVDRARRAISTILRG
jgi:hypothetical protein